MMWDHIIVGGGISGLAIAEALSAQGLSVLLCDARERLGGRILTVPDPQGSGLPLDLGAGWVWPDTHRLTIARLDALGLSLFRQADDGSALHLAEADAAVTTLRGRMLHAGALRLELGMGALVSALAARLPADSVRLGHALTRVERQQDSLQLTFATAVGPRILHGRQIVLAMPPRLIAETIAFLPGLPDDVVSCLAASRTWMATRAKALVPYAEAFWRDNGQSGNGFVSHPQAVLAEIFDACGPVDDAHPGGAALGGFLALDPTQRQSFAVGLPMLIANQLAQLFGPAAEVGVPVLQDWATETAICARRDWVDPALTPLDAGHPRLREPLWDQRLWFAGAEIAAQAAGTIEGALHSAARLVAQLGRRRAATVAPSDDSGNSANAAAIERFAAWVAAQSDPSLARYRQLLAEALARQQRDQLTQRALLRVVEELFDAAVQFLEALPIQTQHVAIVEGRSALMPLLQSPFRPCLDQIIEGAFAHNRTSCALSNFPEDHDPSHDYRQVILRDLASAWREFSLAANRRLTEQASQAA